MSEMRTMMSLRPDRTAVHGRTTGAPRSFSLPCSARRVAREVAALSARTVDSAAEFGALRSAFRAGDRRRELLPRAFALVARVLRDHCHIVPGAAEYRLAAAMLAGRCVAAESAATRRVSLLLAAAAATLDTQPVHLLSTDDRHAAWLLDNVSAALTPLGVSVAGVSPGDGAKARRLAYRADIVVTRPREIALDFLRDSVRWPNRRGGLTDRLDQLCGPRAQSSSLLLPGLYRAFIDRADQCLIDDARIPVVIGPDEVGQPDAATLAGIYRFTCSLEPGIDFSIEAHGKRPVLAGRGIERAATAFPFLFDPYAPTADGVALLANALRAAHLLEAGRHYQRHGDRIVIPHLLPGQAAMTGRDLVQVRRFIECREPGSRVVSEDVMARITYLALFRRYHHVAGAAADLQGVAAELDRLYGIGVAGGLRIRGRVARRCRMFRSHAEVVGFLCGRASLLGKGVLMTVLVSSDAESEVLVKALHDGGCVRASAFASGAAGYDDAGGAVRVATMRDFLPLCGDETLFGPFARVDVYALCLPPSMRHVRECSIPAAQGRTKGLYWQLLTTAGGALGGAETAPPALHRLGVAAALGMFRPLLGPLLTMTLRGRERADAAQRAAALSHQTSIDDLFAFSGRGGK